MAATPQDRWYPPDAAWPRHGDPDLRQALELARRAGWWYRKNTSHTGSAILYCDRGAQSGDFCVFLIFGTGRAPGGPAKALRQTVKRCPHRRAEDVPVLEQIEDLMAGAERTTSAAEALLDEGEFRLRSKEALSEAARIETAAAVELIDVARDNLTRVVDLLIDRAVRHDDAASEAREKAVDHLAPLELPPEGVSVLVEAVEATLREAEDLSKDLTDQASGRIATVRLNIVTLRHRISLIRTKITQLSRQQVSDI